MGITAPRVWCLCEELVRGTSAGGRAKDPEDPVNPVRQKIDGINRIKFGVSLFPMFRTKEYLTSVGPVSLKI